MLTSAFCAGLIGDKIEGANIVNAEMLCHERGIEIVRKSTVEHGVFSSVISATVKGEGREVQAAGTVSEKTCLGSFDSTSIGPKHTWMESC